jgi:hypothetical protein
MNNTTKFISLTNANVQHRGNRIAISTDLIVTVHNALVTREDGITEQVTYIFCPPHGTWEVSEPYEQVIELLNALTHKDHRL